MKNSHKDQIIKLFHHFQRNEGKQNQCKYTTHISDAIGMSNCILLFLNRDLLNDLDVSDSDDGGSVSAPTVDAIIEERTKEPELIEP